LKTSLKIDLNSIKLVLLVLLPYTAFYGVPALPTWRIVNLLFVGVSILGVLHESKTDYLPKGLLWWQLAFFCSCIFECAIILDNQKFGNYEAIFIIGVIVLFLFCNLFYLFLNKALVRILRALFISVSLLLAYQVFQELVFLGGKPELATLLNERGIEYIAIFYRIIGPLLGSPGFMAESGHVALFVGPLAMNLLLIKYYNIAKINQLMVYVCLLSLGICLSGGAVIHGFFIGLILLIISAKQANWRLVGTVFFVIALFIGLISFVPAYQELIVFRIQGMFTGDSERIRGAKAFLQIWEQNPWFGLAPKSSRFVAGDPNVFIPVMLADHGVLGLFTLLGLWFVPLFCALKNSKRILFVIPYISLTIHLFLAYGTFTWPIIWINLVFSLWGLNWKPKMLLQ